MKKFVIFMLVVIAAGSLYIYSSVQRSKEAEMRNHKHQFEYSQELSKLANCQEEGLAVEVCTVCGEKREEVRPVNPEGHNVPPESYHQLKAATLTEKGRKTGVCVRCGKTVETEIPTLGTLMSDPYEITPEKLYQEVKAGRFKVYEGKYVRLKGNVTWVSSYSDLYGAYLYGKTGNGVVVWMSPRMEEYFRLGSRVDISAKVKQKGDNPGHVELELGTMLMR